MPALRERATWHMIGHLQKNKVRRALRLFDVIQSVDSIRLAQALERVAGESGRALPVYIEVNVAEEATKFGVRPKELFPLAETLAGCAHLRVEGLMTIPPYTDDPEAARPYFRQLRELLDQLNRRRILPGEIHGLSMGMSHDFEVAIEEGATLIRLGTAIWGPRPQP
ncbi:MAG: YggS family pyridoxal phosphate-dependent enzyme [Acidobacteria bacterium]|nr:MAG: YggS family pyridoxal phosphate-dependent enzyme [Acidobacteriota bacterium]